MKNIDLLIDYCERWMAEKPRRSLAMLARYSGVPYPTLRRTLQKEASPLVETALSLLNIVASVEETLEYLGDNKSVQGFISRMTKDKKVVSDEFLIDRLSKRESWWIAILAMTIGASDDNVRSLLGVHGMSELNSMLEDELLYEKTPGVYRMKDMSEQVHFESVKVGSDAVRHIAEFPAQPDDMERFLAFNIPEEKFDELREMCRDFFEKISSEASAEEGSTLVAGSIVLKRIQGEFKND